MTYKKKLEQLNLKKRLNVGYFFVIALMILSGIISIACFSTLYTNLNHYIHGAQTADTAVKMCRIDVNIAARNIREMALNDDTSTYSNYKQTVVDKLSEVDIQLKTLKATGIVDADVCQEYSDALQKWGEIGYAIIEDIESGDRDAASEKILKQCAPALQDVVTISDKIDDITNAEKEKALRSNQITVFSGILVVIVVIILATIIAARMGRKIVNSLVIPVRKIERATEELAKGNLQVEIDDSAEDEIGEMAGSLKSALQTLAAYVQDISVTMHKFSKGDFEVTPQVEWKGDFEEILDSFMDFEKNMAHMVENMRQVSNQVKDGSGQIADSSNDLADGAARQATIVEELASTLGRVSEQVSLNAENAITISEQVQESGRATEEGNCKMKDMVEAMLEIDESSAKISKIIASINEISSQTNLLALNASIEAARAGEAGKGFAVVADQVSVLAAQSAEAAKESASLIQTSVEAIEKGMFMAHDTAQQLQSVANGADAVVGMVNGMADELKQQAEAIRNINNKVAEINDVVQTNSATSQECAAASQQMSEQAVSLEKLICHLKIAKTENDKKSQ